jgi:hypothetical protein
MLKKLLFVGVIALSFAIPMTAHAAPKRPPAAKGCTLYGQTVAHGTQIDFQDRWGNTISSYTCFNGVWLRTMRA